MSLLCKFKHLIHHRNNDTLIVIYTFYNSSKITSRFVNVTVTIVHYSYIYTYIYIYIDGITLIITSEEHYYYHNKI